MKYLKKAVPVLLCAVLLALPVGAAGGAGPALRVWDGRFEVVEEGRVYPGGRAAVLLAQDPFYGLVPAPVPAGEEEPERGAGRVYIYVPPAVTQTPSGGGGGGDGGGGAPATPPAPPPAPETGDGEDITLSAPKGPARAVLLSGKGQADRLTEEDAAPRVLRVVDGVAEYFGSRGWQAMAPVAALMRNDPFAGADSALTGLVLPVHEEDEARKGAGQVYVYVPPAVTQTPSGGGGGEAPATPPPPEAPPAEAWSEDYL